MVTPAPRAGETGEISEVGLLIQGYSSYLLGLGKSPRTVEEYARDVRLWSEWFKRPPEYFREPEWDDYVSHLQQTGKRGSTIKRYCIALRRFFKYLRRRKIVQHDPSRDSEPVKALKTLPTWLLESEVDLIISRVVSVRSRAILEVLYSCGLRNEELRALTLCRLQNSLLQVIGKGRKERIVPIPARAKAALDAWLEIRPKDTDLVFPSKHGKMMTGKTLRRLVQSMARKAGITKSIGAHTFRHSIATHLASRNVRIEKIQLFLGHESPETTMIYIHLADSIVQSAILQAHPRS